MKEDVQQGLHNHSSACILFSEYKGCSVRNQQLCHFGQLRRSALLSHCLVAAQVVFHSLNKKAIISILAPSEVSKVYGRTITSHPTYRLCLLKSQCESHNICTSWNQMDNWFHNFDTGMHHKTMGTLTFKTHTQTHMHVYIFLLSTFESNHHISKSSQQPKHRTIQSPPFIF